MKSPLLRSTVLAAMAAFLAPALAAPASAEDIVIHAGRLIDGVTAVPRTQVSILIHDDRITSVVPGYQTPAGARVIDLSQQTVLPGLIDAHVHLGRKLAGNPIVNQVTLSEVDAAYDTLPGYAAMLHAGFTTVRNVGAPTAVAVGLRRAIDLGDVVGPRMMVAGTPLGPTGGHSDPHNGLAPDIEGDHWADAVIDGADSAVAAVRRLHRQGADVIKIMPSGGVLSRNDNPDLTLMSDAEISAVVNT
ncbi:MAG TPA: amidohydrolase family protein, partial [Novosphingobium sp.]|nr:amidohydrolase family protein [Novosphingobium sp.]